MEHINIFLVHDTIVSPYDNYENNMQYIYTKKFNDEEFISWLCRLFYDIKQNCNINISINNYASQFEVDNFNDIKKYISEKISYYPIDKKNYTNIFFNHIQKICAVIYQQIWNVNSETKNLILIYTENSDVIYNANHICNQDILKNIDEFNFTTIGYIIKCEESFYFMIYGDRNKYISKQLFIYKNKNNFDFIGELKLFIEKLLLDIEYKQKIKLN